MEQSGQPATDQQGFEVITQAKRFMDADESQKTAILDGMFTVKNLKSILPDDLSTWSKSTTTQVLQKTLNLCEIPRSTEDKSYKEVQWEQDKLQRRLDELTATKAENEWILEEHRRVKEQQDEKLSQIFLYSTGIDLARTAAIGWYEDFGAFRQELQQRIDQMKKELDQLESPLKD